MQSLKNRRAAAHFLPKGITESPEDAENHEKVRPKVREKGLSLSLEDTDAMAFFDAKWVTEALANILDNAVKYTEQGAVKISVISYEMFLRIDIADSGIGIPESEQAAIPLFYLFDTPNANDEADAESYLADLTADEQSGLMYESKAILRADLTRFQKMFILLGGLLCAIIGIVGILNFFNAIMTGILSRKRDAGRRDDESTAEKDADLRRAVLYPRLCHRGVDSLGAAQSSGGQSS